jgi:gas vesicle protein
MKTILILATLILLGAGVVYFLIKKGKIKDADGDFIPDVVEDKVDEVKQKVSKKVKEVKTRVKEVKSEVKDVVSAIKGKPTKSKLNSFTKEQLVSIAKSDHGVELDISVQKSTLVNKVYSLYNKPHK